MNRIDKSIIIGSTVLALDSILSPFFTGSTLHEHLGFSMDNYDIRGRTIQMTEQALWGASAIYCLSRRLYR